MHLVRTALATALIVATSAEAGPASTAQPTPSAGLTNAVEASGTNADGHETIEEVTIYGHPLGRRGDGLAQPVVVLRGEDLERKRAQSIGETVAQEPGIQNASFGRAVGRPVIRGLDGARVRVLQDDLDTIDVSATSADHAVTVEPFVADQIEILKGPATLLFGSGASGGIVDVHTGRVVRADTDVDFNGRVELRGDDASDERTGALRLDGGHGGFRWHIDGMRRRTDDYEIPGFAESRRLHALEEAEHEEEEGDEEHEEAAEARDRLPNSDTFARGGALAGGYITDGAYFGASVSRFETDYGVPGHGHEDEHDDGGDEEEHEDEVAGADDVRIDLRQTRYDFVAGTRRDGSDDAGVEARLAFNRYEHNEVEGDGSIGTAFENDGHDLRVLVHHAPVAAWSGAVGLQWSNVDFSAVGEEAFVPPSRRDTMALFASEAMTSGANDWQAGFRYERAVVRVVPGDSATFHAISASLGVVRELDTDWSLALQLDRSARAPVAEELFADGPHLATLSYERGDAGLDLETAINASATLRGEAGALDVTVGLFASAFGDYIYLEDTGEVIDELPVRQHRQGDATFVGGEAEVSAELWAQAGSRFEARIFGDIVRARLDERDAGGNRDIPRLAPARAGVGLQFGSGPLSADLTYMRVNKQSKVTINELPTDAYDRLDLHLGWHVDVGGTHFEVFARGINLTDDEARNHLSPIKDLAPLPGRTLMGGVRMAF